ncbi:phosphorylated adapter RNA export protein [Cyclospora cayetanensis]|uniref:Phosphorylated adapter RNA export protein n=1 Tax=Cyclospora cayetanensis TaxID=88456 RepID=A0A6P6RUI0_9EIME|nr:phosphorylated adapter RNA export protein [Cyclospora cayetanensis]
MLETAGRLEFRGSGLASGWKAFGELLDNAQSEEAPGGTCRRDWDFSTATDTSSNDPLCPLKLPSRNAVQRHRGRPETLDGSTFIPAANEERVAEFRAEILDGVRHLLHDEAELECLVQLCMKLNEKNTALLERAIHRRGVPECMELLEEALELEARGGMMTAEGRRRTPGGVFLRLLQDRVPREDKRFIWDEQNREQRRLKRQRIRSLRGTGTPPCGTTSAHQDATKRSATACASLQPSPATQPDSQEREPGEVEDAEAEAPDGSWK